MGNKTGAYLTWVESPHSVKLITVGVIMAFIGGASTGFEYAGFGVDPAFKFLFFGFGGVLVLLSIPLAQDKAKYESIERQALRDQRSNDRTEVPLSQGDLAVLDYLKKHGPQTEAALMMHTLEYPRKYTQDQMLGLWFVLKCRNLHGHGKIKIIGDMFSLRDDDALPDATTFQNPTET